jgi:agmatine/peptidylarginine deiminase
MLTWPDESTPWYELEKVQACYVAIASAIQRFERVLLVAPDPAAARARMEGILASGEADALLGAPAVLDLDAVSFHACPVNDTWARDHGGISVHGDAGEKLLLDFVFNGWGLKFAADLDNQITAHICEDGAFRPDVLRVDMLPFVLEGGSIDTDGRGTLLTTTRCLCSVNRNEYLTREEIEAELKEAFGLRRILWLDDGTLDGDDTDSHVDILARFCGPGTIAYLQAEDPADPDYEALRRMHGQLARRPMEVPAWAEAGQLCRAVPRQKAAALSMMVGTRWLTSVASVPMDRMFGSSSRGSRGPKNREGSFRLSPRFFARRRSTLSSEAFSVISRAKRISSSV